MEMSQTSNAQDDAQNPAYDALERMFSANVDKVLDIEILPSSADVPNGQLFFEDELGVGIPKKVIVAAFVKAREVFAARSNDANDNSYQDASRATPIILLFDPEYLTAANFRKKHLLSVPSEDHFQLAVKRELIFLDSVLTSPLHRQSKSPTLWYHRYWLISTSLSHLCSTMDLSEDFLKHELIIIFRSAGRHQHNYYAWQYARRLISLLDPIFAKENSVRAHVQSGLLEETLKWCLQNPSDISGWSFLLFLIQRPISDTAQVTAIMQQIAEFTTSYRWNKEALWHFLRTTLLLTHVVPVEVRTQLVASTGLSPIGSSKAKITPSTPD